jgi:hypothetical protein
MHINSTGQESGWAYAIKEAVDVLNRSGRSKGACKVEARDVSVIIDIQEVKFHAVEDAMQLNHEGGELADVHAPFAVVAKPLVHERLVPARRFGASNMRP